MGRPLLEIAGDLQAGDKDEVVVLVGIEGSGLGDHVVVGDEQELIAVILVRAHHSPRRFVAVGIPGVGVGIALHPAPPGRGQARGGQENDAPEDPGSLHAFLREPAAAGTPF